jgi:hypothetical protein
MEKTAIPTSRIPVRQATGADSRCLMVFLRAPREGAVKTRLARGVGSRAALALYRCFVEDLVHGVCGGNHTTILCYHPPGEASAIEAWLGKRLPLWPQEGSDLGERMAGAFARAFASGFRSVVLVGSDIPDLPRKHVTRAFAHLDRGDAVVGPSDDGGFCLVGFRAESFHREVFTGIAWGTPLALSQTLERIAATGVGVHRLPPWQDIDRPEDLAPLALRLERDRSRAPRTREMLRTLGWLVRR